MKAITYLSNFMIPFLLFYIVGYGLLCKRDIYTDFLEGAKDGLKTVFKIVPTLIGLMTGVGVLRASGFLDFSFRAGPIDLSAVVFLQCCHRPSAGYF